MQAVSAQKPVEHADIERTVRELAAQHGVAKVSLFGSWARGEQTPDSDIDLLVEKGALRGLEVFSFQRELSERLGRDVDLVTSGGVTPRLGKRIEQDEVVLYEAC